MIMTVSELKQFIQTEESEKVLEAMLQALELSIRSYTNNNFMVRSFRTVAVSVNGNTLMYNGAIPFRPGDTLQITESELQQNMLVTVESVEDGTIILKEDTLFDEGGIVITKVAYPQNVKVGVANMLKWQLEHGDKVGVQSETISRHSVTYFNMDNGNSAMGFPSSLLGYLKPYKKARFGGGIK